MEKNGKMRSFAIASLFVFVFLLGFSFSVQAYAIRQKELNSPVNQYLRENYGVNSIEEYRAKLEQEAWLNYSQQMEALASEHPELNLPQNYLQAGTSTYQPPKIAPQPFYAVIFSEPITALQIFSLSGPGLISLAAVPPVRKNKRLKQALVLGVVVLCVFSVGYFVGTISAQTGTITIEPGSFAETASYVVWTDGTYVYAKNGKTGAIDFKGTDASTVIQDALNALTSGRTWKEKVVLKGNFTGLSRITIPSYTIIEIQGILKVKDGLNDHFLYMNGATNIEIHGGIIDGNRLNQTVAKYAIDVYGCKRVWIDKVHIKSWLGNTIQIEGASEDVWVTYCSNEDLDTSDVRGGLVFTDTTKNSFAIGNRLYAGLSALVSTSNIIIVGNNVYGQTNSHGGIYVYGKGAIVANNHVSNCEAGHGGIEVRGYGNLIIGNVLENNLGYGMDLDAYNAADDVRRCVIIGNIARNNSQHGIRLNRTNGTLADDIIIGNSCIDNGAYGIYIENVVANNIRIENNVLLGNTSGAFYKGATPTNIVVKGNMGYVTENSGTVYPANNGTVITHGLAGTPNLITLTLSGSRNFATGCYLLDPTVIATNSTTFTIELLYYNITANAYYAVTPSVYNATIYWNAQI